MDIYRDENFSIPELQESRLCEMCRILSECFPMDESVEARKPERPSLIEEPAA